MSHVLRAVLAVGFAAAVVGPARADDAKAARGLVDKAIKAHGGADALAKHKATVTAFKGKVQAMGMDVPITGEISTQGADKLKVSVEVEAGGQKFTVVSVVAGDKGWTRFGDATTEMDKDAVAEAAEQAHASWLVTLVPLIDAKGYTLATAGEQEVGGKKAVGVKVSAKGRRDVTLYFDKDSGLIVKYEHRVKDEETGQEVTEENFPSEYKDVQKTKQAMKFATKRDGKAYAEGEVTDLQLHEKLDDAVFDKP